MNYSLQIKTFTRTRSVTEAVTEKVFTEAGTGPTSHEVMGCSWSLKYIHIRLWTCAEYNYPHPVSVYPLSRLPKNFIYRCSQIFLYLSQGGHSHCAKFGSHRSINIGEVLSHRSQKWTQNFRLQHEEVVSNLTGSKISLRLELSA